MNEPGKGFLMPFCLSVFLLSVFLQVFFSFFPDLFQIFFRSFSGLFRSFSRSFFRLFRFFQVLSGSFRFFQIFFSFPDLFSDLFQPMFQESRVITDYYAASQLPQRSNYSIQNRQKSVLFCRFPVSVIRETLYRENMPKSIKKLKFLLEKLGISATGSGQ